MMQDLSGSSWQRNKKNSRTKPEKIEKTKKQKYFVNCIDCDFLTSAVDDLPSQSEWISDSQLNVKHGTTWRTLSFVAQGRFKSSNT